MKSLIEELPRIRKIQKALHGDLSDKKKILTLKRNLPFFSPYIQTPAVHFTPAANIPISLVKRPFEISYIDYDPMFPNQNKFSTSGEELKSKSILSMFRSTPFYVNIHLTHDNYVLDPKGEFGYFSKEYEGVYFSDPTFRGSSVDLRFTRVREHIDKSEVRRLVGHYKSNLSEAREILETINSVGKLKIRQST